MPHNKKILVVEDDVLLRECVMGDLIEGGYDVLAAENGEEALRIVNSTEGIKLIISDVRMPKMNGIELFEKIMTFNRGYLFILMTGYSDQILPEFVKKNIFAVFPKPYNFEEFDQTVAKAMNSTVP